MDTIKKLRQRCLQLHRRYKEVISALIQASSTELAFLFSDRCYYISHMKTFFSVALFSLFSIACNSSVNTTAKTKEEKSSAITNKDDSNTGAASHWKGSFSNGMKGAIISFDVEKNEVKNLTFQGYWRCDGKLELTTIGPDAGYVIKGNAVDGTNKESGFYFELHGTFTGNKASGTLRFAFVAGGCDTYKLNWTATKE